MTKTLYLLRHAKSDRTVPHAVTKDHARPLSPRGRKAAAHLAKMFESQVIAIDRVYCSTAKRTRDTFELIRAGLDAPAVSFRDSLYLMPGDDLIAFVQAIPDTIKSAMVIGHNPGLHDAALMLIGRAGKGQSKMLEKLRTKYPTGGLCALSFDVLSWKKAGTGMATLTSFVRPRDLTQDDGIAT
jgi:phosphohistidine phosphatase